ncbi:hypothetical protein FHR90_002780 [Endobacter medicaginis]|uniref:Uncharacterized protein n=1 Tax=Endobacter medicaginis TaxID=1181271 RepID=A0A839V2F2_9PROT|nr:hypothetical protein [Endobacter medicaginis]MBB3174933.1 hypothetical protein [Endobacter medicaginis]MCX5476406.1 hypothetical protein [Endobacter medicaginis]NVN29794.1 hypothetical protein [Endobacter medicaginis]
MNYVTGDIFVKVPSPQTLKAWLPLWDCISILFLFQNSDVADGEDELPEWRIYWVAGLALLRTVGHVLAKVDAKISPEHAEAIAALWKGFQDDRSKSAIFWTFIDRERNNLLKTYSFGAKLAWDDNQDAYVEFEGGLDAFDRFREAVYWWRHHLMALEHELLVPTCD